jgi:hypothetical protein
MCSRTPGPGPTSSARPGRRALALVALFVYLAGVAHLTIIPHVACAEHGGWVEAPTSAPSATRTVVSVSGLLPHEHCIAPGLSGVRLGAQLCVSVFRFAADAVGLAELTWLPARDRRRALLRLAPKGSPPSLRS